MADKNTEADKRIKELETSAAAYIAEIGRLQARLGELSGEVGRLRGELQQKRGVRPAARALYHAVDKAVTMRLERGAYRPKPPRRASAMPIPEDVLESDDLAILSRAARRYDAAAYFRAKASKSGMRPGYRLAIGVYTATRDVGLAAMKRVYRLAKRSAK